MLASSIWMCLFQLAWYLMVYKLPLYQRMLVVSTTDSVVDTQLCELCDTNGKILQKWGLYKAASYTFYRVAVLIGMGRFTALLSFFCYYPNRAVTALSK